MNLKFLWFLFLFFNIWLSQIKLYAGQISVINPSSGSSAAGVISVTATPSNISQSSTNIGQFLSDSESKYIGINKDKRILRILSVIKGTNISLFSQKETKDALATINFILNSRDLDSYTLGILQKEIIKLKQNLD